MNIFCRCLAALLLLGTPHSVLAAQARERPEFTLGLGGTGEQVGNAILPLPDGDLLVAGYTGTRDLDAFVARISGAGEVRWFRRYGGSGSDVAWAIAAVGDGTFDIAGNGRAVGAADDDMWLFRVNAAGDLLQSRHYPYPGNERATAMVRDASGRRVLVGQTVPVGGVSEDARVLVVDASGAIVAERTFAGPGRDRLFSVALNAAGPVVVGLISTGADSLGGEAADRDPWMLGLDWSLGTRWELRERVPGHQTTHAVIPYQDGTLVTGYGPATVDGDNDLLLWHFDAVGRLQWKRQIAGPADDHAMMTTPWGDHLLTVGYSRVGTRPFDAWFLELNADGTLRDQAIVRHAGDDWIVMAVVLADGSIVATGKISDAEGEADALVMRRWWPSLRNRSIPATPERK